MRTAALAIVADMCICQSRNVSKGRALSQKDKRTIT